MSKKSQTNLAERRWRIFIVDWHILMRHAVTNWINRCSDLEVCGEAGIGVNVFRNVERSHPDMIVCEIMQPLDLGFIRKLHQQNPLLPILIFSIYDEAEYGARARAAGAAGYLMKTAGGEKLIRSIHTVLRKRWQRPAQHRCRLHENNGKIDRPAAAKPAFEACSGH